MLGGACLALGPKQRGFQYSQTLIPNRPLEDETGLIKPISVQSLASLITPADRFFVRDHFVEPEPNAQDWRLTIEGQVEQPLTLSYEELLKYPARAEVVTIECTGNPVGGKMVSTGTWGGVPLQTLLQQAKVKSGAKEIILEGVDEGVVGESEKPVKFSRSIPLSKALDPATLLAMTLNSEKLPSSLGFPLRAVIPGWYGANWVKWLKRIVVTNEPFEGFFNTRRYIFMRKGQNGLEVTPAYEMRVKSEIAHPLNGSLILHKPYIISGTAWSGNSQGITVEVTVDGGEHWSPAELDNEAPYAWRLWKYQWQDAKRGTCVIGSRATDSQGRSQPLAPDPEELSGYGENSVQWVKVSVA
jgi:DMSO/TMAO reductase YedYZ molybdopterin-dependent catalytic subunit